MIEVIYKEENQDARGEEGLFSIPRNIRQIGLVGGNYRIYIEDYVYTFLGRLAGAESVTEKGKGCLAVLVGEAKWKDGAVYLFIRGALMAEEAGAEAEHIDFSENIWAGIHEEQEKYFSGQEIVGWFFAKSQQLMEVPELFARIHQKYFGGEKVLMLMEPVEREDAFFCYENGQMVKQRGYYIYYEKNTEMQDYMIEKNRDIMPVSEEETQDEAVRNFRKIIRSRSGKKNEEEQEEAEHTSVFSYAATACLVIAVLAVGGNFYKNYQDMRGDRRAVQTASAVAGADEKSAISVPKITKPPVKEAPEPSLPPVQKETLKPTQAPEPTPVVQSAETAAQQTETAVQPAETAAQSPEKAAEPTETVTQSPEKAAEPTETAAQSPEKAAVQPTETMTPSPGLAAESAEAEAETVQESAAVNSTEIYREESDVRKAKRREALEVAATERETYVIRPGDTLYQISMVRYGNMEAISEICRLNGIRENEIIYPGQVIVLP